MKLSIVIPCFNEEEGIEQTNNTLLKLITAWVRIKLIDEYEIIYVDDGSEDNTLTILRTFTLENENIKVISFSSNFGHQAALTAGLQHAAGDAVVSLDADLQDPPDVIETMLHKFEEGFEIVFGVRKKREKDSLFKRLTAQFFYSLMKSMGVNLVYDHADFRLLSKRVVTEFNRYTEVNRFIRGIIPMMGFNHCTVEYERKERFAGITKYPLKKMLSFAIEGIISFSFFPLRIAALMGFGIFSFSLILSLWALIIKLSNKAVAGWTSTVLPIYFLGGIQLMFLGVLGEYIGKIYLEVKRRPLFIIKDKYNCED